MAAMTKPEELFEDSCQDFLSYPQNLVVGRKFDHILQAYAARLNDEKDDLFDDTSAEVAFWDFHRSASSFHGRSTKSLDDLKSHVSESQTNSICRHVFLSAYHSRAPLDCSAPMLKYLLSYHQTMPQYLDLLFSFGEQELPRDFYYTSFGKEILPSLHDTTTLTLPGQGRSGHEFRQCYNLWSVERSPRNGVPEYMTWHVRQAATYHSFDTQSGNSLWISTKANKIIRDRVEAATKTFPPMQHQSMLNFEGAFAATLFTHLISFEWCSENWRWYIGALGDSARRIQIKTEVSELDPLDLPSAEYKPADLARMASEHGNLTRNQKSIRTVPRLLSTARGYVRRLSPPKPATVLSTMKGYAQQLTSKASPPSSQAGLNMPLRPIQEGAKKSDPFKPLNLFTFGEYQALQRIGERLQEAKLAIGLNIGILDKVSSSYSMLSKSEQVPVACRKAVKSHIAQFSNDCASIRESLKTQQYRLEVQIQMLENTKSLFNNILEFRNTEINKYFALNQYWSNRTMEKIAQRTAHETASMHIITLVTLVFLPGTFVATFFNGGNFSWNSGGSGDAPWQFNQEVFGLFMKVSVPMMVIVSLIWLVAYRWARDTSRRELEDIESGRIPS